MSLLVLGEEALQDSVRLLHVSALDSFLSLLVWCLKGSWHTLLEGRL